MLLGLALCLLGSVGAKAQVSKGWLVESVSVENDRGLGYAPLPVIEFGTTANVPLGKRWVLDVATSYDIAHKIGIANGYQLNDGGGAKFYITPWFGVTGSATYSFLKNSSYHKGGFNLNPGVEFRTYPLGIPSHIDIAAFIPNGTIDRKTGIESNRISGFSVAWDAYLASAGPFDIHMTTYGGYYHGYSEGNPQCDGTDPGPVTCPRASWATGNIGTTVSFYFPRTKDPDHYW